MTDMPGGTPPFGSFPGMTGFPQGDMMEKMWDMMKLNPFAAAAAPGGSPSLSMMSDMLAPLTNVEELDKRIKDMRAVEQWLKLNLNMLQSAIQALEVQRATLATLRAFGAFAQTSMEKTQASSAASPAASGWPAPPPERTKPKADAEPQPGTEAPGEAGGTDASFDPSGWWNMLQSQFNSLAALAIAQQNAGAAAPSMSTDEDENGDDDDDVEPPDAAAPPEADDADAPHAAKKAASKKAPARKAAPRKKPL
ncbi:PhaM family polyhydroxyalkanoate granule multifunctional regulatory protein [Caballeronia sp. 15711]|uniref:PhaM family polyhydroxyalkanoate granule multifunctional regulatory protein n=1 Tax=Caballeronia sp. 15711 TaxID=3391029 RepID=UPI0039E6454E